MLVFTASCSSSGVKRRKGCKGTGSWDGKRNLSLIKKSSDQQADKSNYDRSSLAVYRFNRNTII